MNQRFTYSIPTRTLSFPATASHICVSEPRPTFLNHPVQPLKGLRESFATAVSYRALAPNGANMPFRIPHTHSALLSIVHCSLYIGHWTYTFSAKERDPETGLSYFGSRYYSSDLSIWLSVDPMSAKYPSLSPYTYCANNPVRCVDPNGEEVYIIGDVNNKNTVVDALSNYFNNITVGYDEKTGKLKIVEGVAQTEDEIAFANALSDTKIEVNLQLVEGRKIGYQTSTGDDIEMEGAGAFLGNYISYNSGAQTKENIAKVHTLQCLSVGEMKRLYKEKDWGQLINHEITESFNGGIISSKTNIPGRDENWRINLDIYKEAHITATPQPCTIGASWFHH